MLNVNIFVFVVIITWNSIIFYDVLYYLMELFDFNYFLDSHMEFHEFHDFNDSLMKFYDFHDFRYSHVAL